MTHALVEWLVNNAQVKQVVGLNGDGDTHKVYPVMVPQGEKAPYVCVRVTSVQPQQCKGEATLEEVDTVQVDCYHNSYHEAYLLYRVVRDVLDGHEFTASDGTKLEAVFDNARDATATEMNDLGKRDMWGIVSIYTAQVSLGDLT